MAERLNVPMTAVFHKYSAPVCANVYTVVNIYIYIYMYIIQITLNTEMCYQSGVTSVCKRTQD